MVLVFFFILDHLKESDPRTFSVIKILSYRILGGGMEGEREMHLRPTRRTSV